MTERLSDSDDLEACQRCGEKGDDRRTLYHSCWYDMSELQLPFKRIDMRITGMDYERSFFTLRVCKRCRSDWLTALAKWFHSSPSELRGCGSGIFVRALGSTIELTENQWREINRDEDPVRLTDE